MLSTPQKTFYNDLIYNVSPAPHQHTHTLSLSIVLFWFIFLRSTDHHLMFDIYLSAFCLFACLPHTLNWGQELCFVHCLGSTYNNIWHVVGTKKNIFFCSSNKYFLSTHFIMLAPWDVPGWEVGLILHCSDSIGSKHTGHCVEKNSQVSSKLEGWGRGRLISNVWHGPSNGEMCHLCSDL